MFFNFQCKTKLLSYIVNLKLDTVQESNWSAFQIPIKFITINPISGLIGQIYWWIMDLFTKIVGLTRILLEKIGVANIPILSRPHVLVEVLVQFRAMRPGEITHMPLLGSMTSLLMHTVAHSTEPSFRPKINNQPLKKLLSLAFSWVKVVKMAKFWLLKSIFYVKNYSNLYKKKFHWNISI